MVGEDMQCGPRCRSKQHSQQQLRAIIRGNLRQVQLFLSQCHNPEVLSDVFGRTALHAAASCGKWDIADWLLSEKCADLNVKDKESGWTALHRALFYGQLTSARLLISHGANLRSRDLEGLTALALAMKDRLPHVEFIQSGLTEVFTWGDNSNFNLGHDSEQRKKNPESVDFFRKRGISVKQIVMCKYHSVFLTTTGEVYTCGHGRGGRLGHGTEQTCLEPKLLTLKDEICCQVAASKDHSVMLMESGNIYSCGLNDFHQLGQYPPPTRTLVPKQLNSKVLKGKQFTGILAQRYHTVLYNTEAVFTFGLNAGQLGHQKNPSERIVSQPHQVSALVHKEMHIKLVAASDGATVVITSRGDVYALHEYQCRRIVSKHLDIEQISVSGGNLDHRTDLDNLREHGGSDLTVAFRTTSGKACLWRSTDPLLRRCAWLMHRQLFITDLALNISNIIFVTKDGEAFTSTLPRRKPQIKKTLQSQNAHKDVSSSAPAALFSVSVSDLVERDDVVDLDIERVSLVHRAVGVACDGKGRNTAVLQAQANASLTEIPSVQQTQIASHFLQLLKEADTMDLVHDVVLQIGAEEIPAHKYILAARSEYFQKLFLEATEELPVSMLGKPIVHIDGADPELFKQLIKFIYTDSCDLLTIGKKFSLQNQKNICQSSSPMDSFSISEDIFHQDYRTMPEVSVCQSKSTKGKKKNTTKKKPNDKQGKDAKSPVKMLQDLSKRFGIKQLTKRLESVTYNNGSIDRIPGRSLPAPKLKFYRNKFPSLYDVCLQTEDGDVIPCHKCVLVARLEYFRSMMASGWVETSRTSALVMPVPSDVLQVVIDYLYVDDSSHVRDCGDAEFLCNVLVLADQLLMERLKEMCEVTITGLIVLRNACELLEFATMYNAKQLKVTCQQFVTINLTALLETRSLDVLSDEVIEELSEYYKDTIPGMDRRRITPDNGWPDITYLESLEVENADVQITAESPVSKTERVTKKNRGKKKRLRTKSTGEEYTDPKSSDKASSDHNQSLRTSISSETGFEMELDDIVEGKIEEENPWTKIKVRIPTTVGKVDRCAENGLLEKEGNIQGNHTSVALMDEPYDDALMKNGASPIEEHLSVITSSVDLNTHPLGLRSIMAEQERHVRKTAAQNSTQSSVKKSGRISQKERKRLLSAPSVSDDDSVRICSPPSSGSTTGGQSGMGAKPKSWASPTNAWGAVTNVVKSFKDLMMTEESDVRSKPHNAMDTDRPYQVHHSPRPSPDLHLSWGLQVPVPRNAKSPQPVSSPGNTSPSSSIATENPWQREAHEPVSPLPEAKLPLCLTDIMNDEILQKKTLDRAVNKPLALIQIEEQAMLELLKHYNAEKALDECITVERVHTALAAPTWAATQKHREP